MGLKYGEVRDSLLAVNGVTAVHNLHIWALTMNQAVLTAHVAISERKLQNTMNTQASYIDLMEFLVLLVLADKSPYFSVEICAFTAVSHVNSYLSVRRLIFYHGFLSSFYR